MRNGIITAGLLLTLGAGCRPDNNAEQKISLKYMNAIGDSISAGRYETAIAMCDSAITAVDGMGIDERLKAPFFTMKAGAFYNKADTTRALEFYKAAVDADVMLSQSSTIVAAHNAASIEIKTGDYRAALQHALCAHYAEPDDPLHLETLGMAKIGFGYADDGLGDLRKALGLARTNADSTRIEENIRLAEIVKVAR